MKNKIVFWVSFVSSIALIVGGFFAPPTGVISGSVLTAVGELFAFAALFELPNMIEGKKGKVSFKKGDTEISIHQEEDKD